MNYTSLDLPKNCIDYAKRIDSIQELYELIKFETIFEPVQLRIQENGKMNVKITSYHDLNAWQKEIAYSSIIKMRTVEKTIYSSVKNKNIYSLAILLRHHMENAGLLALAVEVLLDSFDKANFEILNKFISKTWFGNSFYNKPLFRDSDEAFLATETVTISKMINALDNFLSNLSLNNDEVNKKAFNKNYTFLCQIAHPNAVSSCFFTKTKKVKNGNYVTFDWDGDYYEEEGLFKFLNILYFNMVFGLSNYYIFLSYRFMENMSVIQDQDIAMYAYHEILNRFNDDKSFT